MEHRLALWTWQQTAAHLERSRLILVPIGSTEQHGRKGALVTDHIIPEGLAVALAGETGTVSAPPLPFGPDADMLASVEVNYQGATALAVPRGPGGQHIILGGVVALRYPKAEWGERAGCVGLEGRRVDCAPGIEVLLRFLTAPRRVGCSAGAAGAGDGRCEWIWSP